MQQRVLSYIKEFSKYKILLALIHNEIPKRFTTILNKTTKTQHTSNTVRALLIPRGAYLISASLTGRGVISNLKTPFSS